MEDCVTIPLYFLCSEKQHTLNTLSFGENRYSMMILVTCAVLYSNIALYCTLFLNDIIVD